MTQRTATAWSQRINYYVPGAQFAQDVDINTNLCRVDFGSPAVASATGVVSSLAITNAAGSATYTSLTSYTADANFGRAISVKGDTAGDDAVVTVKGRDYLGQPMLEAFTLNGTTGVNGSKAFYYIDLVSWAAGNANASSSIDIGWLDELGMPYKAIKVLSEESDGATVSTLGSLTAFDSTDPATSTTNDPRGTYNPQTTLDGSKVITGTFIASREKNTDGNGGLYGIQHYYA